MAVTRAVKKDELLDTSSFDSGEKSETVCDGCIESKNASICTKYDGFTLCPTCLEEQKRGVSLDMIDFNRDGYDVTVTWDAQSRAKAPKTIDKEDDPSDAIPMMLSVFFPI